MSQPRGTTWRRNAALLGAAVVFSALLFLFLGPARAPDPPPGLASMAFADGTLTVVENDRLVLEPFGDARRDALVFAIRPADTRYFDIAHMQSHSSVALPTRIYYERSGERLYARFKEDAPANSRDG